MSLLIRGVIHRATRIIILEAVHILVTNRIIMTAPTLPKPMRHLATTPTALLLFVTIVTNVAT
jgi:hypothetical protein